MLYDLSQSVYRHAPQWATFPAIAVSLEYSIAEHGFNAEHVQFTTHSGMHVDTPFHFFNSAETVDQLPLDYFVGPALTVDLRDTKPGSTINAANLRSALAGRQIAGSAVFSNTSWGYKRGFSEEYLEQYLYLTGEGAESLIAQGIKGVGTDCLSIGGFQQGEGPPAHEALLNAKKLSVEDLYVPEVLMDGKMRWFAAFPVKLKGASAAWTRAIAWDGEDLSSRL